VALTAAEFKTKFTNDFNLYGLPSAEQQTDILVRALRRFAAQMDSPIVSESLSVASGTARYSVPAAISKIQDIRNADGVSVNFTLDKTTNELILQSTPSGAATYTVYGVPKNVRTDIDTILALVDETHEPVLYAYIEAYFANWAKDENFTNLLLFADKLATDERSYNNRLLNTDDLTMGIRDARGKYIGDSNNPMGRQITYNNRYGMDL